MYQPLTDEQWTLVESFFETPLRRGRGKPHAPWRTVLNSILFVLLTGAKWGTLPKTADFASKSATHRWFLQWDKNGFLQKIVDLLHAGANAVVIHPQRRNRTPVVAETLATA